MGAVASRYARALFAVARQQKALDQIEEELVQLKQVFEQNPQFLKLLNHPLIEQQVKKDQLKAIFTDQVSPTVINFLNVLVDRNRETELADISSHFSRLANDERGLEDAYVSSAEALDEEQQNHIAKQFSQVTGKQIRLHAKIDTSILGGIKVQIGDRVYDGSLQGRLSRFKRRMVLTKS